MEGWRAEVLNETVRNEIAALPEDIQVRLTNLLEMMEQIGPHQMHEPHVKHLHDKLWELRLRGRDGIARALYVTARGRRIVILHAFAKKTQKTPPQAIRLALTRAKELEVP